jgi:hypothetical protein
MLSSPMFVHTELRRANQNSADSLLLSFSVPSAASALKSPQSLPPAAPPSPSLPRKILPLDPLQASPFALLARKTQNPLLCFQSLAHSSAIRWGWGVPHATEATQTMSSRPQGGICFFPTSLSLLFATLTESSILRIPQPLCLPLLRKLPGCLKTIPNVEPLAQQSLCREFQLPAAVPLFSPLFSFDFQLSTFNPLFSILRSFHGIIRGLCFP